MYKLTVSIASPGNMSDVTEFVLVSASSSRYPSLSPSVLSLSFVFFPPGLCDQTSG